MARVFVAGHNGMVGSAIVRTLKAQGHHLVTAPRRELDLADRQAVTAFLKQAEPEIVVVAAAKVGGIHANDTYPAEFILDNLLIESHLIDGAFQAGCNRLLFLGSSCIYPKMAPQPMEESSLLTNVLEPTNEPYAIAKIAGIKMCEAYRAQYGADFISAMPTNLYGPNDNYDLSNSHVLPALIRKFHEAKIQQAKEVEVWGTGAPKREFLHVDDLAEACFFLLQNYSGNEFLNIGTGEDLSIKELALKVKTIIGFEGELVFDTTKPDGTPRKLMNVQKVNSLGWRHKISLDEGIKAVYDELIATNYLTQLV